VQWSNETVLIDQYLQSRQDARVTPLPEHVAFELLAAQSVLRDYQLSDEEIELGRVGGGMDGGIDGFYTFSIVIKRVGTTATSSSAPGR
jgi:hypothetical protein